MKPVFRILAPTDFSDAGNQAVKQAMQLAGLFGAELHLLHIVSPAILYADMPELMLPPMQEITEEMTKASNHKLNELKKQAPEGLKLKPHTEESAELSADAICGFAKKNNIDLIVIGSHGNTGLMHILLGSTAERVVREAECDVLVIKPAKD